MDERGGHELLTKWLVLDGLDTPAVGPKLPENTIMSATIALFGATGGSGRAFLPKALDAGYEVRALVRDPARLEVAHPALTVLRGDVLNADDVARTVSGTDYIVSLIGHRKDSPADLQSRAIQHLIAAARSHGTRKIISLTGGGVPYERDEPKLVDKVFRGVMGVFFKKVLNDAIRHAAILRRSGLPYVIVRGPRLTDGPARGSCRVGYVGVGTGTAITRTDLADFILTQLESEQYTNDMPFVSA